MNVWAESADSARNRGSATAGKRRNLGAVVLDDNPESGELGFEENARSPSATSVKTPNFINANEKEDKRTCNVENIARESKSAPKQAPVESDAQEYNNDSDRPESARSKVSFAAIVFNAQQTELMTKDKKEQAYVPPKKSEPKQKKGPSKGAKMCRRVFRWTRLLLQLIIVLGVVTLCLISAVLSFMKFIESSGQPASIYKPKKMDGPHVEPGMVFIGVDLDLITCELFNFTSLDLENLPKNETCDPMSMQLLSSDSLSGTTETSLPPFMTQEKESGSNLHMHLVRGPAQWMFKHASAIQLTVPITDTGTWGILVNKYDDAQLLFETALTGSADDRWLLAADLILGNSMNFVSADYQTVFLMSKQDFKEFGSTQATRIDMEISLLGLDKSGMNEKIGQHESNATLAHVEALFQWKDGYIMEGDTFMATSPFQIVTVISGVLLMLERAYNTFMRLYNSAKKKKKEDPPPTDETDKIRR
ncbi:uncharacterized protein LOC134846336 isoform X2 [Symsagittifera roscoffensis]|uniref:uncharacterized protein LOC134846336 isoform X2 n=1 Tax=Symsagittifera roscoffensis TaxID=84072 RepID=UPI00307CBA25